MFVPAILQAKSFVLFWLWYSSCFEVKCWFHSFSKRCSHISMGILILSIIQDCHVNSFPTGALLFKTIQSSSSFARLILRFLNGVHFTRPKLSSSLSHPPTHFSLWSQDSQSKYPFYSCEVSSSFLSSISQSGEFLMKMLQSFKIIILHSNFFSGGFNSSFRCRSYPFLSFVCFSCPCIS